MIIKDFEMKYWDQMIDFNRQMYPTRKDVAKLQRFRMIDHPNPNDKHLNVIMLTDTGEIAAQNCYNSTIYYFRGTENECLWGYDLIVKPELRKMNYGLDVLEYIRDHRTQTSFASGINETALKIEKILLKSRVIGYLRKYIKITNPFFIFFAINRQIIPTDFPGKIGTFKKINDPQELQNQTVAYNSNLIEFIRDRAFLNWRFFNAPHPYVLYASETGGDYFVVRPIIRKYITALVLVDYRCTLNETNNMDKIIETAIQLTKKLRLPLLISASSLSEIDNSFSCKGFMEVGAPRPVTMNRSIEQEKESVKNRKFVLLTLADSDGEINW